MTSAMSIYTKAKRHLGRRDPVLKQLMRSLGPCTLKPNGDRFAVLVRSIIAQQISSKAARSIGTRLVEALAPEGVTPVKILRTSETVLRAVGLSAPKLRYLQDLADKVHGGTVPLVQLHSFPDEEVIAHLIQIKGIGRWTAEMFLIFSLGRLDVLPVDDLGLRVGVQRHYDLADMPKRADLIERGEAWRPYRTIATWYFWRSVGGAPPGEG
jgi:DNA-3-methyladenine glycosylase II